MAATIIAYLRAETVVHETQKLFREKSLAWRPRMRVEKKRITISTEATDWQFQFPYPLVLLIP